jgi:guanosine-3',5'-bis(diphosphate) 3'-pyrophosphohydrolase
MSTQHIQGESRAIPPTLLARFDELKAVRQAQRPGESVLVLEDAFRFAAERHGGQTRQSGEPYLAHPLEVAHILASLQLDTTSLVVALLHDTIEDTRTTVEEVRQHFGPEVARCVDGVTKLSRVAYSTSEDRQAETFRKMLLAMVEDTRVILVKLADRLHNMRTLDHLSPERQRRIASVTLDIYAPIALRLGMGKMRSELEDLSLSYLEPQAYQEITHYIESRRESSESFLAEIKADIERRLAAVAIPAAVAGRIKRPYSIYRKLQRQKIDLDQVYDLLALRVITDSKQNCYAALGVIHDGWRPIPDRIKDFVAMPRPNLYQSLHTSVITAAGQRFEVQLRTEEMHQMAEEGICSHWKYKEGKAGLDDDDGRISWLRQLVEWQRDLKDPGDFLSTLKIDLYPEEVYVFTPQGKLIVLPRSATPIDFAYAIHTEVGHSCSGAKIDGRIVPLKYRLGNGDIVEIITQKGRTPSADWLSFAKTSRARHKIKQWLNADGRGRAEELGEKLLDRELRRLKVPTKQLRSEQLAKILHGYGFARLADLYAALGYGRYAPRQIAEKLIPAPTDVPPAADESVGTAPISVGQTSSGALSVKGVDDILVYRARCCNPIPGEPIVGYVTRGKGVAVHGRDCPNVQNLLYEAERRIDVVWSGSKGESFLAKLSIYVDDRPNILKDITSILSEEELNITKVESRSGSGLDRPAWINITMELSDIAQLEKIMRIIRGLSYVREVSRSARL